jgi:hypothetical protein
MLPPLFTKDLEDESLANFALTEFSEIERGAEREIGKEEGEVLPGKAAGKGGGSSVRAPLGIVRGATVQAFSRI